jgi:hypothetical protein
MFTGRTCPRTCRRGWVAVAPLAALVTAACAARPPQPAATTASLVRVAAVATHDVYGRPAALFPLLADRVVLYFFRTDCAHCAADLARASALAARAGAPPLVLISREGAERLRAAFGPEPSTGIVVISDSGGAIMGTSLPTRFVPRVVAVRRFRVRLDVTGSRGGGLVRAAAALAGDRR